MKLSFHEMLFDEEMTLWYRGRFVDNLTESLIDLNSSDMEEDSLKYSNRRISFLMAESFQNVVRHGLKPDEEEKIQGTFGIANRGGVFHIFSRNLIENDEAKEFKDRLEKINEMDSDELKAKYLQILDEGEISAKGGAGLGLVDMARKAGCPLQYHFAQEDNFTEFSLLVDYILDPENKSPEHVSIERYVQRADHMSDDGMLMLFKGDLKTDSANQVLKMLSQNTGTTANMEIGKGVFHIGVELLQNMSRHGLAVNDKTEGIFALSKKDRTITLTAQNLVSDESKAWLEEHIAEVNSKSIDELTKWYRDKLKASALDDSISASVGIIDMRRLSKEPLEFSFSQIQSLNLFSISVKMNLPSDE